MCMYMYVYTPPKGNGIGAAGSKSPRTYCNPCVSLLGMVVRAGVWY